MYSLTICFGPAATSWAFLFKEKDAAEQAWHLARAWGKGTHEGPYFDIDDNFGQHASFQRAQVWGAMLEDLDLTEQARIERSMVDARAQTKFNQRAKNDPAIRAAMAQGPSVITPMGRG